MNVTVILLEGGLPSTAITPAEILGSAGTLWAQLMSEQARPYFTVRTVSADGRPVKTPVSVRLQPDGSVRSVRTPDLVIVPAISADLARACARNAPLLPWLRRWYARGAAIAGICSGAALIAEAGLLDGRPATTHWGVAEACRRRYPRVDWQPERIITESDRLFCSGGVYASADLSLHLVEKYCGHTIAMQTARALVLHTPRTWQPSYATEPPRIGHGDGPIEAIQEWLYRSFRGPIRIADLARKAGMSPRTFARRFRVAAGMTPLAYVHHLRISAARHLLESEQLSVQQIGDEVGYEDVAFFRRLFRRVTGYSPRAYRDQFGPSRRRSADRSWSEEVAAAAAG